MTDTPSDGSGPVGDEADRTLAQPSAPQPPQPSVPAPTPQPSVPEAPQPPAVRHDAVAASSPGPPEWALRASDADRERYVDVLRDAYAEGRLQADEYQERMEAAYRARTYAELVPLLQDLPVPPGTVPLPHAVSLPAPMANPGTVAATPINPGGAVGQNSVVAVFGGAERSGAWTVPADLTAFAMFGGVELDLTQASLAASSVTINAVAIFGGVEIRVPEGVTCHVEGIGVFGGFDRKGDGPGPPGAPEVRITGVAVFGGVEVSRGPKKGRGLPPSPAGPAAIPPR